MTFRAKPVVKRDHRPAWETQDRRNFYLNLGFGLIVLVAVLILAIAAGLSWYNSHLAPVGSVDGEQITKDEFADRYKIETWRLDEAEARARTSVTAGHLTEAQGTSLQSSIAQQRQSLPSTTLERLIDTKYQAKLAAQEGVTATPEDIDARLAVEATTPESRHLWVIEVAPQTDLGAIGPSAAQKSAAKAKAEAALKDIAAGKSWEDVARTVSTDASTGPQAGDLGWLQANDTRPDEAWLKAVFAAPVNTPTAVVEGTDGVYRIGRVTEIAPASVDPAYQTKFENKGIDLAKYRAVVQGDVIHDKLQAKIVADVTGSGPQRKVSEIYIHEAAADLGTDAIKVRHILYAPKGDPENASSVPASDPSWAAAQSQATATYVRLKNDPNLFDAIARKESQETQAQGQSGSGGKLPYFDSGSSVDADFLKAITAPGLKDGDVLPPVKSAFGWHVIQVMYHPTDAEHMKALKTAADGGKDFAILARDNSEAPSAGLGGDLGWVAKGQLADELTNAIFATPIGKTSDIVTVAGDGTYLFKVLAEETRTPEGRQLDELKATAFSRWYDSKKSSVVITRDETIANTTGS
jgi:parvulin-like peptidyl-prolyl isomerase